MRYPNAMEYPEGKLCPSPGLGAVFAEIHLNVSTTMGVTFRLDPVSLTFQLISQEKKNHQNSL